MTRSKQNVPGDPRNEEISIRKWPAAPDTVAPLTIQFRLPGEPHAYRFPIVWMLAFGSGSPAASKTDPETIATEALSTSVGWSQDTKAATESANSLAEGRQNIILLGLGRGLSRSNGFALQLRATMAVAISARNVIRVSC